MPIAYAQPCYTYFAKDTDSGLVKIGRSLAPNLRVKSLGPNVKLLAVVRGDYEATYHELFKDHRVHGEWFSHTQAMTPIIAAHSGNLQLTERRAMSVRIATASHDKLRALARKDKLTVQVLIQRAIDQYINRRHVRKATGDAA